MQKGKTVQSIQLGEVATFSKTISESDIYLYAGMSGDLNPAHIDEEYAKTTFFGKRIAHGMLVSGLISAVLGTKLPGIGTIWVNQNMSFIAPVYIGDTITARCEVIEINVEKNRVCLKTTCLNQHGKVVIDGQAIVSPPKGPAKSSD